MNEYVTFQSKNDTDDATYGVLHTRRPLFYAEVMMIDAKADDKIAEVERKITNGMTAARVNGYSLFLMARGCLGGGFCSDEEARTHLAEMAEVFRDYATEHYRKFRGYATDKDGISKERHERKATRRAVDKERKFAALDRKLFGTEG